MTESESSKKLANKLVGKVGNSYGGRGGGLQFVKDGVPY